ncbi:hypothetical protein CASFOL_016661 [Castilleja foliolosa]|uniref:Ubiquinol-cytochrome c chaperone domain-containing protein n=1 Tax=Castilleja foliolosa TaxID=1961234 RepID=A0ABD3DC82_9LAMI
MAADLVEACGTGVFIHLFVHLAKMMPRWSRVLSQLTMVRNLQNNELASRDLYTLSFRNYANVSAATAVDPSAKPDTIKPEVNLNKMFWSKPSSLALVSDSPYRVDDPHYEGIERAILKMMLFYNKQSQSIRWANVIYSRVTYQVDRPAIYDALETTFKSTFSLLVLHMWLCLLRLKEEGKEGVQLGQYVYELFNHDLELRVSKAGVNLLLIKWMKELEKVFYGNIVAYDTAIGKQDELRNVIRRNVFLDEWAAGKEKPVFARRGKSEIWRVGFDAFFNFLDLMD